MYAEIRDSLKTGDLVLFSGGGSLWANIIERMSGPYHHVAMLVADATGGLGLWESTKDKARHHGGKWGVQWTALSPRLAGESSVYVRQLDRPMTDAELAALAGLRREWDGRPYDADLIALLQAARDGQGVAADALDAMFCSELIAAAWERLGWLADRCAGHYTPTDFSSQARTPLPAKGIGMGPEVQIA